MSKKIILTKNAPVPIGPYNQGIITGSMLYTAGQIAIDPATGQFVQGDIKTQTQQVLKNIQSIIEQAGTTMQNVVKTSVFLRDMNDFAGMNEVYAEFFKNEFPARTTVAVLGLPRDAKVEIEAVAVIG